MDQPDHQDLVDQPERLVLQEPQDQQEPQDLADQPDPQVLRGFLEHLDQLDQQEPQDQLDQQEPQDLLDRPDLTEIGTQQPVIVI